MVCPPRVRRFSQRHPTWTRNINARARQRRRRRNGFWGPGIFDSYGRPYPNGNHQGASSYSPSSLPFPPPVQQSPSSTDIPVQKRQIAGVTLSVQINPDNDPIPLEFYISQHDPDTEHVPDDSSPRYALNSNALGDASNRSEPGPSLPGDSAYMVELGLVRAYPSAGDIAGSHETQSWSSSEDSLLRDQSFGHPTPDDSLPSAQLLLDMSPDDTVHLIHPTRVLIRSAVITTAIVVILFIGLHVIILIIAPLISGTFATQNPLGQLPDSPLQPVDWFQEAALIPSFRWSTSASKFLPPHDSLPTLSPDYDDIEMPGSTIYGMPPSTEGQRLDPSPTGRPADVWSIYNLDPPLTQLCRKLETSLQRVKDFHYRFHNQLVFEAHAKSVSAASASLTSSPTPTTTRRPSSMLCRPRRYQSLAEWSYAQDNNGTAHELVDILDITTGHDFGKEMNTHAPHFLMLIPYRDALKETCQHLASLNDRIKQVLTTAHIQDLDWTRTKESFTRLEDVARFLSQIATVRINEMHHRAERGTSLLEVTELRQARLRNEMASGWIGAPVSVRQSGEQLSLVHFPSIQTVMSTWHHTTKWIRAEVSSLQDTHAARELALNRRREKERKDKTSAMRPVIWSRWEMGDTRRESFGREAFCWDWGPVREGDQKGCGDGSLRHGKDQVRLDVLFILDKQFNIETDCGNQNQDIGWDMHEEDALNRINWQH
ncbi:hypothetical protein BHE90_012323 [Fusarium euwallaceae]|uniref:Uncharacterized protein n=1 Tax=Fusarium euwallaceae TaxID=1147111 RepID=A0A430LC40_9HYPO|nr:hypothetical protein BHE90_012323 [Fusarium euwallaceae]